MKRRAVIVTVSDHAVLRWLEREHGLNVDAIKAMLAGRVLTGAELGAVTVVMDHVRCVLVDDHLQNAPGKPHRVVVATVLSRDQPYDKAPARSGGRH